jgi:orotate phosphoribosyltransferase
MFYAGYGDMWQVIQDMAGRMPDVDAIAGVPVSGLAPAGMLSAATGIKCVPLEAVPVEIRRLLVLEDASGFAKMREQRLGQAPDRKVLYGAVYACDAAIRLDFVGAVAPKPRIFTWNLVKSDKCGRIAYDMDGVLCRDPLPDEIDYGPKYDRFIETAEPLRMVKSVLGWIVTGRMEKYRNATDAWLKSKGVRYKELIMAPDTQTHTMEGHAKRKAKWLAEHPECLLFVESDPMQAARIAELTGRAVVCASTEAAWNTDPALPVPVAPVKRHDRIIYTISTGGYEDHAPGTIHPPPGWDYRRITSADCPAYLSPKQQAAWAKINGPRIFAEYAESLCIDDDMEVTGDPAPMFDGAEMTTLRRESCPKMDDDLDLLVTVRKAATRTQVSAERSRIIASGVMPDAPCYMSGIMHRRHSEAVRALCDEWWYWYGQSETQRDQPSMAAACALRKYTPSTITEAEAAQYIRHDTRKADRDGVRLRVESEGDTGHKTRRRGDRT